MKSALSHIMIVVGGCFIFVAAALLISRFSHHVLSTFSGSQALLAGQSLTLNNTNSVQIEIDSDIPVTIVGRGCEIGRSVQTRLACGPGPILITDSRPRFFVIGRANHVAWNGTAAADFQSEAQQLPPIPGRQEMQDPSPSVYPSIKPATDTHADPGEFSAVSQETSETMSRTNSLMPGQTITFPNDRFRKVEVRSMFPVRVLVGPCHNDSTFQFFCESQPDDIVITDTRRMPILRTPVANSITVTVTEF